MLWLALHFPLLPLEALGCYSPPDSGLSAFGPGPDPGPSLPAPGAGQHSEDPHGYWIYGQGPAKSLGGPAVAVARGRVVVASPAARAAGVEAGMRLSSALGLAPGLVVRERQAAREAAALAGLACWAGQFTPHVSLAPPACLLLEVAGCLRLFGGLAALHGAVRQSCAAQGFSAHSALAPTPLGATWLAWGRDGLACPDLPSLRRALGALPADLPAWEESVRRQLAAFGIKTLGQLLALPRAELARRIGPGPVAELSRAMGEVPDPRPGFDFPERFCHSLELPAKVESAPMLAFAGRRLLESLAGWLAVRGAGVAACILDLKQDDGGATPVALRPAAATRDGERLLRLLRERLERLDLPAPVVELALRAEEIVDLPGTDTPLFAGEACGGEDAAVSLERLRARLGEGRVFTLETRPDYRPECATRRRVPAGNSGPGGSGRPAGGDPAGPGKAAALPSGVRPLWLLPEPRPLPEVDGRPQWGGPLSLLAGPERLESGWWDEGESEAAGQEGSEGEGKGDARGDVRRDYFVAGNGQGQRLWIFRDAVGWFLHGIFS